MNYKSSALILTLAGILGFSSCAEAKKATVKSGSRYATVLQSTRQRTLPGAPGSTPIESFRIMIVWKNTQPPATFFWRDENGSWFECYSSRVHKKAKPDPDSWYTTETQSLEKVKKNDTLELIPTPGGKYPVPAVIPEKAVNTLFFKTTKSNWMSLPVNNIKKKPDIVMP